MINDLLHLYYLGVLKRLRAEVDLLNQIIPHSATKGVINEDSLRHVVMNLIPRKYSIGSGIIIDSFGNHSRQIDLVIYDSQIYPVLFSQASMTLFPVETVVGAIEVKTYLDNSKLEEAAENVNSVRQLRHYASNITMNQPNPEHPLKIVQYPTRPPLTLLVAFRVDSGSPATWKERFEANGFDKIPEASLLMDIATVFKFSDVAKRDSDSFEAMYFQLRDRDLIKEDDKNQVLFTQNPNEQLIHGDNIYKSTSFKKDDRYPIFMPERAFLSFLILVIKLLDMYPRHISFDAAKYIDAKYVFGQLL